MTSIDSIGAVTAQASAVATQAGAPPSGAPATSFGDFISQGLANVENRIDTANDLARRFALDDTVPIHEVTVALEQARIAVELMLQVRTQLLEGYRQVMNMQL